MATATNKALEAFLGKLAQAGDRKELRRCLLAEFGGMSGLAKECKVEYEACDSGSMGKNRLLTAVLSLVGDKEEIDDPVPEMSTTELMDAAEEILSHASRNAANLGVPASPGSDQDAAEEAT